MSQTWIISKALWKRFCKCPQDMQGVTLHKALALLERAENTFRMIGVEEYTDQRRMKRCCDAARILKKKTRSIFEDNPGWEPFISKEKQE